MEVKGYVSTHAHGISHTSTYGPNGCWLSKEGALRAIKGTAETTSPCLVLTGEEMEWYLANKPKGEK